MDSPKNKIKSKDINKILKEIGRSKNAFRKSNVYLSQKEIRDKIEKSLTPKDKLSSILSTNEKIRYKNISNIFLGGSVDYFSNLIWDIKKKENRILKDKFSKISFPIFEKENKDFKLKKKSNKKLFASKLALFGVVFGTGAYLLKEIYDNFIGGESFSKINNILSSFLPVKLTFYPNANKIIDGEGSSFALKMKDGEEISISDEHFGTNPIEETSKTFDNIIFNNFLKDGINNLLNNIGEKTDKSIIGYLIFTPLGVYINRAKEYLRDSLYNPKIPKMYKDNLFQIKAILATASESLGAFGVDADFVGLFEGKSFIGRYQSRFSNYILESKDGYTKILADIQNGFNSVVNGKKDESKYSFGTEATLLSQRDRNNYLRKIVLTSDSSDIITNKIENFVEIGSIEEVIDIINKSRGGIDISTERKITKSNTTHGELSIKIETGDNYILNHIFNIKTGNIHNSKNIKDAMGNNEIGKFRYFGSDTVEMMDETEKYLKDKFNPIKESINEKLKNASDLIFELFAQKQLQKFYDTQDKITDFLTKNNLENIKRYETDISDDYIYFNKNTSTYEKLNFLTDLYFDGRNEKGNFIHNFITRMGDYTDDNIVKMENIINNFNNHFSAFDYISHISSINKKDETDDAIKDFYSKQTILMSQTSDISTHLGASNRTFLHILSNFTKSKYNFRNSKLSLLKRLFLKIYNIAKEKSSYFEGNGYDWKLKIYANMEKEGTYYKDMKVHHSAIYNDYTKKVTPIKFDSINFYSISK